MGKKYSVTIHYSRRLRRTPRDDIIIQIGRKLHLRCHSVLEEKGIELFTLTSAFFSGRGGGRYHRVPTACTHTKFIFLKYCANRLIRLLGLSSGKRVMSATMENSICDSPPFKCIN